MRAFLLLFMVQIQCALSSITCQWNCLLHQEWMMLYYYEHTYGRHSINNQNGKLLQHKTSYYPHKVIFHIKLVARLCNTVWDHSPLHVINIPAYHPGLLKWNINLIQSNLTLNIFLSFIALCTSLSASFTMYPILSHSLSTLHMKAMALASTGLWGSFPIFTGTSVPWAIFFFANASTSWYCVLLDVLYI